MTNYKLDTSLVNKSSVITDHFCRSAILFHYLEIRSIEFNLIDDIFNGLILEY